MKQFPFAIQTRQELEACIDQVQQEARKMKQVSSVLVSVFTDKKHSSQLPVVTRSIQAVFPEAQVIGAVAMGEIINGQLMDYGMTLSFTLFECSQVRVMVYDFQAQASGEAGREVLAMLEANRSSAAVGIIAAGFHLDINPFFRQVSKVRSDIVFFGGLADDGSLGQNGLVFAQQEIVRHGLAVALFSGSRLHVQASSSFGWKPLGQKMTVTKMDGAFCLQELDYSPALEVFDRYLGIRNADSFQMDALTFPFYFERNGTVLARHPRRCRDDGSVMFGADLREGEQVRLAYGDPEDILDNAMSLQTRLAEFQPEAIFMVSCVARWMLLGSDTEQELSVCGHLAPTSGFYAYGEFMRNQDGEIMVSNMTLVTIGMREGLANGCQNPVIVARPQFSKHRSMMTHLIKFIEATTQELEDSNHKLAELARIDRLTNLCNRGETEAGLHKMLMESRGSGEPLSILMLDVDDFKGINDGEGHAAGDTALRNIADILRQNTRKRLDLSGRWGGDEFLVALGDTDVSTACEIAERIRQLVAGVALPDGIGRLTVSIGVVTASPHDSADTLFRKADAALYEAKLLRGKNDVVIYSEEKACHQDC